MQHWALLGFISSHLAWKEAIQAIPNAQHKSESGKRKYQEKAGCSSGLGTQGQQGQETKPWLEIQTQTPWDLLLVVGEKDMMLDLNPHIKPNRNWNRKGEHPKALTTAESGA